MSVLWRVKKTSCIFKMQRYEDEETESERDKQVVLDDVAFNFNFKFGIKNADFYLLYVIIK